MPGWDIATEDTKYHHYRLRKPSNFIEGSFRTKEITSGISMVMGKLKDGSGNMVAQNIMFDKDKYTPEQAKKWLEGHPEIKKAVEVQAGPGGECVCPECGHTQEHETGKPCNTVKCEKCGHTMERKVEKIDIDKYVPITKIDVEKRVVVGIVLEPDVVDLQGDIYDAETIEKSAHNFLKDVRNIGLMHRQFGKNVHIIESYLAPVDFMLEEKKVKRGTWIMAVKVADNEIWNDVKNGKLNGFSIGARASYEML